MQIDGRTVANGTDIQTDLCVVGAGAAGITLCLQLADTPLRIMLIESGGDDPDPATQQLAGGENTGLPYFPLDAARLRCFGGTTAHWGGFCRPFYDIDFEERPWVPYSGWPISRKDLLPFYPLAQKLCQLGPFAYETADWQLADAPPLSLAGKDVLTRLIQFSPPTRFGVRYRNAIISAPNIRTYLNSNVVAVVPAVDGTRIERLDVATLAGNRYTVHAGTFVIAAGGIENARLLLASNQVIREGIGNKFDLVGRFFAEHINLDTAGVFPRDPKTSFSLYQRVSRDTLRQPRSGAGPPAALMGYVELSEAVQRSARTLNYSADIEQTFWSDYFLHDERFYGEDRLYRDDSHSRLKDMEDVLSTMWRNLSDVAETAFGVGADHSRIFYKVVTTQEQAPNPDSRVMLSAETDRFGRPLTRLCWELTDLDRHTIRVAMERLTQALGAAGIGSLHVAIDLDGGPWPTHLQGSWHHSGTTRMHRDPRRGVVDADCRVHGMSNLYIAGASVFPTIGNGNPTLTIVAMTARLAEHLRTKLKLT
jgi:choline dehydrogenase-like flavoprotein